MKKLKAFDLGYFIGKSHFDEDGAQHYLVFQPILMYFTLNSNWITKWKSKGLSNESLEIVSKRDNTLTPSVNYYGDKVRLRFTGSVLQQTVTYSNKKVVNLYVVYEITNFHDIGNYPTLANALFGAIKLTKNAEIDKYKYFRYGIGFDGHGSFSNPSGGDGKNIIIFGVDMNSSTKVDNKKKDILIFDFGPTQGLFEHSLTAEKMCSINLLKVIQNLHYNRANSYLFVIGKEIHKFTAKYHEIVPNNLCLGNVSKDFSASNMKKTGFNGQIYDLVLIMIQLMLMIY